MTTQNQQRTTSDESFLSLDLEQLSKLATAWRGTQTPKPSLENMHERLERLAFPPAELAGLDRPPLETYTTTPTAHGDVVSATPAYRAWFRRAYPAAGPENRLSRAPSRPDPEGMGGEEKSPLSHFKAT